jgi:PAS domain S-box-containing protein
MKTSILIVEDEIIIANNLRDRLTGMGHSVCGIASSGAEAIKKVTEVQPDLILMDIKLQGEMDGVACAQEIRSRYDIPVIYLTGYADERILQRAKLSDPYGYILKPFEVRDLQMIIEMALHKHVMEKRLRESEEKYRTLVEHSLQGIMVIQDVPPRIIFANPSCAEIIGYSVDELLNLPPHRTLGLVHPDDQEWLLHRLTDHLAREPIPETGEFRVVRKDGTVRWVDYFASIIERDGSPAIQVAFVDITARKRAEEALRQAYDELEQRVEERTSQLRDANRRLRKEVATRREAEWALQRRTRELEMLHSVAQALSSSLDLDDVLANALDQARHLLDAVGCTIWLLDPQSEELICLKATGPCSETLESWQLEMVDGIVGWVARHGQSLIVPDTRADERHFKGVDRATGLETRSLLSVPLKVKQEPIGVLQVAHQEPSRFDETDLALLEPLAASAAIAIENARLYDEANELRAFNENIVQSMQEGIVVEDENGCITYANPAAAELLEYPMEELIGQHWGQIVESNHNSAMDPEIDLRSLDGAGRYETVLRTRQDQRLPVLVSARRFYQKGRFTGHLRVFADITERKRVEEALQESEARYRTLFEDAPLCIFEVDLAQTPPTILRANRQTEAVYGWSPSEITSVTMPRIFSGEAMPDHQWLSGLHLAGETVTFEATHRRKDGSPFPVRFSATPVSASEPKHIILAVEDITAEKNRRSEEEAIAEERRRMAREIHDGLAQNLASLRLRARLWHNVIDEHPERMHDEVEAMRDFLSEQIREVRRSIFALRPVALDELGFYPALRQFVDDFGEQNRLRIDLRILGAEGPLPSLLEPVLFRIVQEALNNVSRHAEATSASIDLDLRNASFPVLVIRDDGQGFDTTALERASRLGHLGLTQMRERVEELGGTLQVQSRAGRGTEIRVVLPAV